MSKNAQISTSLKKEAMLKAMHITQGVVKDAASLAQITPQTHYGWYKNDESYRDRIDTIKYEIFEEYKDLVLDAVFKKIKEGNTSVINNSFKAFFGRWAEQMERSNPYRPRLTARIKYVNKPEDGNM